MHFTPVKEQFASWNKNNENIGWYRQPPPPTPNTHKIKTRKFRLLHLEQQLPFTSNDMYFSV